MHVNVVHPALVVRIAKGGRKERHDVVRCVTPLVLREEPASDFEPVATIGRDIRYRPMALQLRRDALWSPVLAKAADGTGRPVTMDEFRVFLEGGEDGTCQEIAWNLVRTPLVAWAQSSLPEPFVASDPTRGVETDVEASRTVVSDGRADAAADAAAFVAERIVVAGGVPMLRRAPLAAISGSAQQPHAVVRIEDGTVPAGYRVAVATPETLDAVARLMAVRRTGMPPADAELAAWRARIPEAALTGEAVRVAVNGYATYLRHDLGVLRYRKGLTQADVAVIEALHARMAALEILSVTGVAHRAGADAALGDIVSALDACMAHGEFRATDRGRDFLAAYIGEVLLPDAAAARAGDIAALSGLAF